MPDYLGADQRKTNDGEPKEEKVIQALDEGDIALLKAYNKGPYADELKSVDKDIKDLGSNTDYSELSK